MKYKLFSLFLAFCLLVACSAPASPQSVPQTRTFIDDAGRAVEIPTEITRVAVSGALAQMMVFAIAPDSLVGLATDWDGMAAEYLDESYYTLPLLGQFYSTGAELNAESLLTAEPQLVIDIGEPKGDIAADMDALQEQLGIPFIHLSADLAGYSETFLSLGDILAKPNEAQILAEYCTRIYKQTLSLLDQVDQKKEVVLCLGDSGTHVLAKGSYQAELLNLMANNIAVVENPSSQGSGNEIDLEQLLLWNPEVIIFNYDSIYDTVGADPRWQDLDAIKNGHYFETPYGPYNWTGNPPSVQRYLGMLWLGELLYPEQASVDLQKAVTEYYELFYHCELNTSQYRNLLQNSIFA